MGKGNEQKRRPGEAGKGSAGEKTEQKVAGQTKPGCGRAGENDWESGGKIRDVSEKSEKRYGRQKPALD